MVAKKMGTKGKEKEGTIFANRKGRYRQMVGETFEVNEVDRDHLVSSSKETQQPKIITRGGSLHNGREGDN